MVDNQSKAGSCIQYASDDSLFCGWDMATEVGLWISEASYLIWSRYIFLKK